MGEIIVLMLIVLSLLMIYCLYKIFDIRGLYFSIILLDLIAFVLSFKISYIFKMNINLGIIPLIASFSILYILIIKGKTKDIKNIYKLTLYSNVSISLLLIVMNYFIPAITETVSINMQGTFEYNYKILIIYPFMVLLSQYTITKLYSLVNQVQPKISLNIILTYIITAVFYTIIFYMLCYIGNIELKYSLFLGISTYIIGLIITLINIYFVKYMTSNSKKVIRWEIFC